jgi:hypothetical protein
VANPKWENRNFTFDGMNNPIFMASPPASNQFKLEASAVPGDPPHIYEVVTLNAGDVAPFWSGLKLLPQGGKKLTMTFAKPKTKLTLGSPAELAERKKRMDKVTAKVAKSPFAFERLVGFVTFNGEDNPVSFYKVEKGFTDGKRALLVVDVNLIGAGPGGFAGGSGDP